ncbi:MAG: transglutaminase domain-containing protein [Aristaeellaceae bacterium]
MKKRFYGLLMVLLTCAVTAQAEMPYAYALIPAHGLLNGAQQTLFEQIYDAATRGEESVPAPEGITFHEVEEVMALLWNECPELCALGEQYSISYYQHEPDVVTAVSLTYDQPLATQDVLLTTAQAMVAQVTGTAWDRELALHDMLCEMTTYDLTAPHPDTAYGALVEGRATCGGYARALTLLCRLAGIPCWTVCGTTSAADASEKHLWCAMNIGGVFTQTDPTWDDQDSLVIVTHWYLNLTDEQMGRDHTPEEGAFLLPCTDESLSWHARKGLLVPAQEEAAEQAIMEAIDGMLARQQPLNLRFATAEAAEAFLNDLNTWLHAYYAANPDAPRITDYATVYNDRQYCVLVLPGDAT